MIRVRYKPNAFPFGLFITGMSNHMKREMKLGTKAIIGGSYNICQSFLLTVSSEVGYCLFPKVQ